MRREYYQGRLALVTGGSEGIGRAIAEDLVGLGAHVVIWARNKGRLENCVTELKKRRESEAQVVDFQSVDVTSAQGTREAMQVVLKSHGVPFFLFNCAGFAHPGYIDSLDIEAFRGMMEVNYFGTLHTTKALVPSLIENHREGHIVNVSSMAGFLGLFGYTGYCASKYAVVGFSLALRHELRPYGISVSVLCPPNTRTPGLDRENQFKPKEVLKLEEKAKVVNAADVSRALLEALPKKKKMIVPTFDGTLAYHLSRLTPGVVDLMTRRPVLRSHDSAWEAPQ